MFDSVVANRRQPKLYKIGGGGPGCSKDITLLGCAIDRFISSGGSVGSTTFTKAHPIFSPKPDEIFRSQGTNFPKRWERGCGRYRPRCVSGSASCRGPLRGRSMISSSSAQLWDLPTAASRRGCLWEGRAPSPPRVLPFLRCSFFATSAALTAQEKFNTNVTAFDRRCKQKLSHLATSASLGDGNTFWYLTACATKCFDV